MHVISDSCVACGTCSEACPAGAIAMDDNLGRYAVSDACVDCGACEDACPMGCIAAE